MLQAVVLTTDAEEWSGHCGTEALAQKDRTEETSVTRKTGNETCAGKTRHFFSSIILLTPTTTPFSNILAVCRHFLGGFFFWVVQLSAGFQSLFLVRGIDNPIPGPITFFGLLVNVSACNRKCGSLLTRCFVLHRRTHNIPDSSEQDAST